VAAEPGWLAAHRAADRAAREALARAVAGVAETFDGGVAHRLGRMLPEDAALVVSSSMPLREVETFLTAADRPYKKPKKLSESVRIMHAMKESQHIDGDLFALFLKSGIYKVYAEKFLEPDQIDAVAVEQFLDPGNG